MKNFKKTQVLVLGSTHLRGLGEKFSPKLLDMLVETLKQFRPDLICIESLPGDVIETMQFKGEVFELILEQFASDHLRFAKKAQKLVRLPRHEAGQRAKKLVSQKLTTAKRLELILTLLAAYDLFSAVLQWSYLPQKVRVVSHTLPRNIRTFLDQQLIKSDERVSLGVRLGRELGLQTLTAIDDHTDFSIRHGRLSDFRSVFAKGREYFSEESRAYLRDSSQRFDKALESGDLLPFYSYLNSAKVVQTLVDLECLTYLQINHRSGLDRAILAQWELRNLNMVAHIRRASALYGGKRILVIVGGSHKPLFDRYLKQLTDVKVVQLKDIEAKVRNPIKEAKKDFARGRVRKESAKAHFKRLKI